MLLDQGRIVADGTHASLLTSTPLYSEILAQVAQEEAALTGDVIDPDPSEVF